MPTIAANTAAPVSFSNSTTIIAPGVIASGGAAGALTNSFLVNYGSILLDDDSAVLFTNAGPSALYNQAGALVAGVTGVSIAGSGSVALRNSGEIFGIHEHGIQVEGLGNNVTITNTGEIVGTLGGVTVSAGSATNVRITNSGTISSDQHGIWMLNVAGAAPVIVNSGVISGGVNAILAEAGDRLNVTNSGQILGEVRATSVNQIDTVTNNGTISGSVFLGSGIDSYKGSGTVSGTIFGEDGLDTLTGGSAADRIDGGSHNDTLNGGAGNDTINGGTHHDLIIGGAGRDILTGGANNDTFRYLSRTESPVGSSLADVIKDFDDSGNDRIDLSSVYSGALAYRHNQAFTASGQVRINDISGADVIVEVNTGGSLAADMQIRLTATTLASMTSSDFLL
jgi:Ca2+-binding RTX toxin-like protein